MKKASKKISWDDIKRFVMMLLPVWFIIIGIGIFALSYSLEEKYAKICTVVASSILSGGVFAAILKGLQFTTLFRDELSKVLFGDIEWLASLHADQFKIIWRNIIAASIRKGVPGLSDRIGDRILDEMIPKAGEYYYSGMSRKIKISEYDPSDETIVIEEDYELVINAHDPSVAVDYAYKLTYEWPKNLGEDPYCINSLYIDGLDYRKAVKTTGAQGDKEAVASHNIRLTGKTSYKVSRHSRRKFSIVTDPVSQMLAMRYTDGMTLQVENTIGNIIQANFVPISISNDEFAPRTVNNTTWAKDVNRLIFPGQGLMLVFSKV